ncbi:HDOD domain-containing protein [Thioalkalivibrio sp. ALJT]|uniref:HDOD domain-containing protein n=1 Tax=Thioalkalivibrio sp. ALJT TaxID=1158146 RepID=UPI0003739878|nr:HDOD domain-containing protein [Thioalkalivibrio sp. ALJT]
MATRTEVEQFLDRLRQDLERQHIEIPTLPDVSVQALFITQDASSSIIDLVKLVSRDTALAARLIRHANSPAYRGLSHCSTIRSAVTRLGMERTRQTIMALSMKTVFQSGNETIRERMEALWNHSLEVAIISYLLARRHPHLDPDTALLAGLVHDIGMIPILRRAEKTPEIYEDPRALQAAADAAHVAIGRAMLKSWNFEPEIIRAVSEHENLDRQPERGAPVNYCDILQAANIESHNATQHRLAHIDRSSVASIRRLAAKSDTTRLNWEDDAIGLEHVNQMIE